MRSKPSSDGSAVSSPIRSASTMSAFAPPPVLPVTDVPSGSGRAFGLRDREGDGYALPRADLYRRHTVSWALFRALIT